MAFILQASRSILKLKYSHDKIEILLSLEPQTDINLTLTNYSLEGSGQLSAVICIWS